MRPRERPWTRRQWLRAASAGAVTGAFAGCENPPAAPPARHFNVPGEIVGQPVGDAHRIRDGEATAPVPPLRGPVHDCIIVGTGIAGCTAAWKLRRAGVDDVVLLELGDRVGGTSASGSYGETAYPWAAHYVTTPDAGADCLIEVLTDLGVLKGVRDEDGWPIGNEQYVVRHPIERLWIDGKWTREITETHTANPAEGKAMRGFRDALFDAMRQRDTARRRAYMLPVAYASPEPQFTRLDTVSMRQWMQDHGYAGPRLEWNVDYACRDDYGATSGQVSAWAGIHYHACRYDDDRFRYQYPVETFTWPEGNGFLVKGLLRGTPAARIRTGMMVMAIENAADHVELTVHDRSTHTQHRLRARRCIFAGKLHVAPYVVRGLPPAQRAAIARCTYAPWMIAQVHVKRLPHTAGSATAWDNVAYDGDALGYIVANHQNRWRLGPQREAEQPTVLTFYCPFVRDVDAARAAMLTKDHAYWADRVLNDLARMHGDIGALVTRVDVMLYGHGMIVPTPGFIWADDRGLRSAPMGRVHLASADASGLALFEEACFHGLRAAEEVLDGLGRTYPTSLGNWRKGPGTG